MEYVPLKLEENNKSKLLVVFGGINMGMGLPVFEFQRIIGDYEYDKCFIRDRNQAWYHKGIGSEFDSVTDIVSYLEILQERNSYDEIICVGTSMGGYAAMLVGTLINANKVIAFSPQTFIGLKRRLIHSDFRWIRQLTRLHLRYPSKKEYDLLNMILPDSKVEYLLFFSSLDKLDALHCTRMKNIGDHVKLFSYDYGGHSLVSEMKKRGELKRLLNLYLK